MILRAYGWLGRFTAPFLMLGGVLLATHTSSEAAIVFGLALSLVGFLLGVCGELILRRCAREARPARE